MVAPASLVTHRALGASERRVSCVSSSSFLLPVVLFHAPHQTILPLSDRSELPRAGEAERGRGSKKDAACRNISDSSRAEEEWRDGRRRFRRCDGGPVSGRQGPEGALGDGRRAKGERREGAGVQHGRWRRSWRHWWEDGEEASRVLQRARGQSHVQAASGGFGARCVSILAHSPFPRSLLAHSRQSLVFVLSSPIVLEQRQRQGRRS